MTEVRQLSELSREELYDLIWSSPATKVAADFAVSDVAVHKHCIKRNVPRPTRGYWAKIAAGQKPRRNPLPPTADEVFVKQAERAVRKTIALPEDGVPFHALASELLATLNKTKLDHHKKISLRNPNFPEVNITKPLVVRASKAFHVILGQLEPLGIYFRKSQSSYNSGFFKRSHDRLYFFIDETHLDRFGSERRVNSWDWDRGGTPSGRLVFRATPSLYGRGEEKEWAETRKVSLERVISQIVSHIRSHFLNLQKQHATEAIERKRQMEEYAIRMREWQAREVIRVQKEKEQAHLNAIKSIEISRRLDLIKAAEWWQISRTVAAYVDECEKRWKQASSELSPEQLAWLAWAQGIVNDLSPFSKEYPDPLKHGPFDTSAIAFGGPYPTAQNFAQPAGMPNIRTITTSSTE